MKVEIYTNSRGETVIPYHVFKNMPLANIVKAIEQSRKKRN